MTITTKTSRKFNFTKKGIDSLPLHPPEAKSREQEYSDQQVMPISPTRDSEQQLIL